LIVLLYFLKMKRRAIQVPSTYLWKKSIEDLHVNSLFQWMRDNVLLLVQLLIVLLMIYGVMAFQVQGGSGTGKHYILLIDSSASMEVNDADGKTRLEAAKQEALNVIGGYPDGNVGMVIEFNSHALIRQPYTSDRDLLRRAVGDVVQTQRATRLDEALNLADSLADPLRSTENASVIPENPDPSKARTYVAAEGVAAEVHLFSDGCFPGVGDFEGRNLAVSYHRVGALDSTNNVGIVALSARRDEKGSGKMQVFVNVLNFRPEEAKVSVQLTQRTWKDGELKQVLDADVKPLTIPARTTTPGDLAKKEPPRIAPGSASTTFELSDIDDGANRVLQARLIGVQDQFPLDDQAWLVVGVVRKARVLIVTDGDDILHNFFDLDATRKVADVTYLKSAELADEDKYLRPAREGVFDLVIFDRCAPADENAMPTANTFFIGDVPPPWKREEMPQEKEGAIRNPTSKHPLMRNLAGLDEIGYGEAFHFELDPRKDPRVPPRVPKLLETDREGAVMFALPRRAFTDVVLTFPLVNGRGQWTSNWNLKLSFPLFLRNVLYSLGNVSDAAGEDNIQPGEVKALRPSAGLKDDGTDAPPVKEVAVVDPDKKRDKVTRGAQNDFLYKNTERLGVYLASWDGGQRGFAVNLLDPEESDIRPRDEVRVGDKDLQAGKTHGQPSDLWPWAALAAFVLLLVEWALYHFRLFG
jgi:hypothetical protein